MTKLKKLSLAIFETPRDCYECPLSYFGEISACHCELNKRDFETLPRGKRPEWCPLKPVVFDEDYAK